MISPGSLWVARVSQKKMFAPARGRFFVRASAPPPSLELLRYMARRVANRHRRVSRRIMGRAIATLRRGGLRRRV